MAISVTRFTHGRGLVLNVHYYEAKVLEIVRLSLILLANRIPVLSERGADPAEDATLADGVAFADYDHLIETGVTLLEKPERLCSARRPRLRGHVTAPPARLSAHGTRALICRAERRGRLVLCADCRKLDGVGQRILRRARVVWCNVAARVEDRDVRAEKRFDEAVRGDFAR